MAHRTLHCSTVPSWDSGHSEFDGRSVTVVNLGNSRSCSRDAMLLTRLLWLLTSHHHLEHFRIDFCPIGCCRRISDCTWYSFTRLAIFRLFSFSLMSELKNCAISWGHNATPHDMLFVDLHDLPTFWKFARSMLTSSTTLFSKFIENSMAAFCCWTTSAIWIIAFSNLRTTLFGLP